CWEKAMGLVGGEQRVLEAIETDLKSVAPVLVSKFAMFARLTVGEPKPAAEALTPRLLKALRLRGWRSNAVRLRLVTLFSVLILAFVTALVLGLRAGNGGCRPMARTAVGVGRIPPMQTACMWTGRPGAVPGNAGK